MEIIHSIPIKGAFPVLKVKEDCLLRISSVVNIIATCPFICLHVSFQEETFYDAKRKRTQERYKGSRYHGLEGK